MNELDVIEYWKQRALSAERRTASGNSYPTKPVTAKPLEHPCQHDSVNVTIVDRNL